MLAVIRIASAVTLTCATLGVARQLEPTDREKLPTRDGLCEPGEVNEKRISVLRRRGIVTVVGLWPPDAVPGSDAEHSLEANAGMLRQLCEDLHQLDETIQVVWSRDTKLQDQYLTDGKTTPALLVVHSGDKEIKKNKKNKKKKLQRTMVGSVITAGQLGHIVHQPPDASAGHIPFSEAYRFVVSKVTAHVTTIHASTADTVPASYETVYAKRRRALALQCALPKLVLFTELARSLAERDAERDLQANPGETHASLELLEKLSKSHRDVLTVARQQLQSVATTFGGSLIVIEGVVDPHAPIVSKDSEEEEVEDGGELMAALGFELSDVPARPEPQTPVLVYALLFAGHTGIYNASMPLDEWVGEQLTLLENVAADSPRYAPALSLPQFVIPFSCTVC